MNPLSWQIQKIIEVARCLIATGNTGASTSEVIAAAFVLDRQDLLPSGYSMIEAWDRLDDWQALVRVIRRDYRHLIDAS